MTEPRTIRVYEKLSWVLLLVPALILGALSLQGLAGGYSSEAPANLVEGAVTASTPPATINLLNYIARGAAGGTLDLMVLVIGVAVTGYRTRARWAWFVELFIFAASVVAIGLEVTEGQNNLVGVAVLGIPWILGLALPYRMFFPRTRAT
jgi:hypothetical protein